MKKNELLSKKFDKLEEEINFMLASSSDMILLINQAVKTLKLYKDRITELRNLTTKKRPIVKKFPDIYYSSRRKSLTLKKFEV